jgi:hypothetical protein
MSYRNKRFMDNRRSRQEDERRRIYERYNSKYAVPVKSASDAAAAPSIFNILIIGFLFILFIGILYISYQSFKNATWWEGQTVADLGSTSGVVIPPRMVTKAPAGIAAPAAFF